MRRRDGILAVLADRMRGPHRPPPGASPIAETGLAGIRATQVSLVGLGLTAALQAVIALVSGSVALLSDTVHNLADAATAIPLWMAFALGRRAANRRFTFGYHRAEDLAGLIIVAAIALSGLAVIWESLRRLVDPRTIQHVWWVIAAGAIGAAGNELVARYRIRVGRRIGSEALVADGQHARTDALTSLAVVAAGVGVLLGWPWADPVAGLVVGAMILVLLRTSTTRIFGRLLDAVDPALVERAERAARAVPAVQDLTGLRLRWQGHRLLANLGLAIDPDMTVEQAHRVCQEVEHALLHDLPFAVDTVIHVDPHGRTDSHDLTAHHRPEEPG